MSYTLAYIGAEIDALLGKIDAIFVAEYGSTIYSEVTAAIAAGNKVIVANAGKVYVYAGQDDNSGYVFTQSGPNAAKPNATYVTLSTGNVWSTATVDLATLQQFYASLMEDTASGSIASFPDGAENVPVKELTADIEPIQDLHGQASPYPPNGGKNKLPMSVAAFKSSNTAGTWSGNTYTNNGVSFTLNTNAAGEVISVTATGTSTAVEGLALNFADTSFASAMILNGCPSGGSDSTYKIRLWYNATAIIADFGSGETLLANTAINKFDIRIAANYAIPSGGITFYPMISADGGDFAPYSNICPISGYTGAEIRRMGVNVWDGNKVDNRATGGNGGTYAHTGSFIATAPVVGGETYYLNPTNWRSNWSIHELDANGDYIRNKTVSSQGYLDTSADAYFVRVTGILAEVATASINYPSTDTDYHAYLGTTYSIDWTDEAGTVYGGHFVVNEDGSVDLTVDFGPYTGDLSTRFWEIVSGNGPDYFQTTVVTSLDISRRAELLCNKYKTQTPSSVNTGDCITGFTSGGQLRIRDSRYTTVDNFKASLSDVVIAYPRNTVQAYHLASIIELKTLLGDNNIWSDTGDISVKYRANTALYIEKKLGE